MRLYSVILTAFLLATIGNAQSYVDCIIDNFQKTGNIYSFDLKANQTSGPAINVGTSTFTVKVNPAAFTYIDVALYATVTLTNINPRYSGGWTVGDGNYRMMTRSTLTYSGAPQRCEITVNITHWDGYPSSELLPNELICTVRMQIYDSTKASGISWSTTGGIGALPPGSVINAFVGSDNRPLPVTLSSFNVNVMNGATDVSWTTESEINNYGFHVQRGSSKTDLSDAEDGFVAGHGTTLEHHEYSWADKGLAAYYRLRQIDLDGTSHFSDVIASTPTTIASTINGPATYALRQNYPNPFNPGTTITYELPKSAEVRLTVFDMLGREVSELVNEKREAGFHEVRFDGSKLPSGVYIYRLHAGDFIQSMKFVLLR